MRTARGEVFVLGAHDELLAAAGEHAHADDLRDSRTSSPVTALPMIMRWISDVPSKMVKLLIVAPFTRSSPWRSL